MAVALVLSLVAFIFAAGEARAAEQLYQTSQQGTSESTTVINGKVVEPVPEATKPPVVPPPVQRPPAKDPMPSPPPKNEAPPPEEPTPPPVESAPVAPEPDLAPQPPTAPRPTPPQWFAVVVADGEEADDPDPVATPPPPHPVSHSGGMSEPEAVPNASPGLIDPAPAPAAPAVEVDDGYASGPVSDPVLAVPGLMAPAAASPRAYGGGSPPPRPADGTPANGSEPSVPAATASPLGTTATGVVGTVQSAAASVASATTEVLGSLAGASPGTSSNGSTDVTQNQPSEGTSHQAPPLAPPGGGSAFSQSTGGGQLGAGGGFAPLLVGVLALLAAILLGRDFRTYLISCEMPKPSSALLLPLERPG